ncbi:MAG: MFS transporter [Desulfurococcaceae archaeon]
MKRTLLVFLLLGTVSLFADAVYEGGRSISGAFLESLGAPALASALVGFGEFLGLLLRFASGYAVWSLGSSLLLWGLVISGYSITAISIPALAFAGSWQVATALYIVDRVAKGLRAPARDVVIADVGRDVGTGKAFGLHELLDQVGAMAGPAVLLAALPVMGAREALKMLFIPGAISIALASLAAALYPHIKTLGPKRSMGFMAGFRSLGRQFQLYLASNAFLALGLLHWTIATYYMSLRGVIDVDAAAMYYMIAMAIDALMAVPLGAAFDLWGYGVLPLLPIISVINAVTTFYGHGWQILVAAITWGTLACAEESLLRAAIATCVAPEVRPLAYGMFGLVFGLSWSVGGYVYITIISFFGFQYATLFSAATNVAAFFLFLLTSRSAGHVSRKA